MTTEHEEKGGEAKPAGQPQAAAAQESSEVTVAKINRSSAITAAVITGVLTLSAGVITAVVTYNVGVQHGSQVANPGNATAASSTSILSSDPSDTPHVQTTTRALPQPPSQSLIGMPSFGYSDYSPGPETVNTKPYQQTLHTSEEGSICDNGDKTATYQLDRKYTHLHALVGLANNSDSNQPVTFEIETPDNNSTTSLGNPVTVSVTQGPQPIDADITGDFRIELHAHANTNGGGTANCPKVTAVWVDPTLNP